MGRGTCAAALSSWRRVRARKRVVLWVQSCPAPVQLRAVSVSRIPFRTRSARSSSTRQRTWSSTSMGRRLTSSPSTWISPPAGSGRSSFAKSSSACAVSQVAGKTGESIPFARRSTPSPPVARR
ncbi:MAG: hypothetical protein ACJ8J0_23925 [Longimicrobiaceae bacterium]